MVRGRTWALAADLALAGLALGGVAGSPARAAPAGYPVTGIDVSAYQGQVDWATGLSSRTGGPAVITVIALAAGLVLGVACGPGRRPRCWP
jgi:hypothetical protein